MRRLDAQIRESRKKLAIAVKASGTSLTGIFGAGPVIAATVMATWPGSASLRPGSLIAGAFGGPGRGRPARNAALVRMAKDEDKTVLDGDLTSRHMPGH